MIDFKTVLKFILKMQFAIGQINVRKRLCFKGRVKIYFLVHSQRQTKKKHISQKIISIWSLLDQKFIFYEN